MNETEAFRQGHHGQDFIFFRDRIRQLVKNKGWNDKDTPKNLVMALSVEVAELMEPFQWLDCGSTSELGEKINDVRLEMADVFIYLIAMADQLQIDIYQATCEKLSHNEKGILPP